MISIKWIRAWVLCYLGFGAFSAFLAFGVGRFSSSLSTLAIYFGIFSAMAFLKPWRMRGLENILLFLIVVSPFHFFIRYSSPFNFITTAWREVLFVWVVFFFLVQIFSGVLRVRLSLLVCVVLFFNFWCVLVALKSGNSFIGSVLGVRDLAKYSLISVVTCSLCEKNPRYAIRIFYVLIITCVLTVCINLALYPVHGDMYFRDFFTPGKGTLTRSFGPIDLRRLESFMGSGPSHIGVFSASALGLIMGAIISRIGKVRSWIFLMIPVLFSIVLSVSISALAGVAFLFLTYFPLLRKAHFLYLVGAPLFVLLLYLLNIGMSEGVTKNVLGLQDMNIYQYAAQVFLGETYGYFWDASLQDPSILVFGSGLGVVGDKSMLGIQVGEIHVLGSTDGGWAELVYQAGVFPLLGFFGLFSVVFISFISASLDRRIYQFWPVIPLTGAFFALFGSVHSLPWIRVGSDINFWVLLGSIYAMLHLVISTRNRNRTL
ncbi:hypothetical protein [Puniceicoccus vermicola]|uniref:O-antigen ligase domain-containing protein n=1 Tax=Puniceicoccus vermicola TaxID=388746 RepID=A0A7X1AWB7_9BACT|nr:hypothetical protein [Puniceicoccus vermicola]MBC2601193.1 hypothetical protein [Puniceicoccus vermicola]